MTARKDDFHILRPDELRALGIDAHDDDVVNVWHDVNARTIRADRHKAARPAIRALFIGAGWLVAVLLATAVVAEDTRARLAATLAQAEQMGGM